MKETKASETRAARMQNGGTQTNRTPMPEAGVHRNYKDTVFRMIFREKENLLSLYNALNGTAYTDVDGLEITTLENAVYMNYKNDISFVFGFELLLYEHQSTYNHSITEQISSLNSRSCICRTLLKKSRMNRHWNCL